jgi:Response regulator receiver domain
MPAFRHGLACALLAIWLLAGASDALSAQDVHRVLVVYENESTQATAVAIGRGLHERLNAQGPTKFEIYSEYLDNARFPEPENQERLAAHFAAKYAHRNIDVAIALGPNALKFLLDRRDQILRGAPLVFGAVSKDILTSTSFPENATGVAPASIVYIVDDDLPVSKSLERLLSSAGYQARSFPNAEDFLLNHKPDVPGCAIIDLNLPGMDGLSLQEALSSGRFIRPAISARAFS